MVSRYFYTKLSVFYFLLFFVVRLNAQEPILKHFGVNDGLPSSEVYKVLQDHKGFIWFATDRGVVKYDGYKFQIYDRKDGLPDNTVFNLFEDAKGRIWFITYKNLLSYYENGRIKMYPYNSVIQNRLKNQAIYSEFYVDEHDNVFYAFNFEGAFLINAKGEIKELSEPIGGLYVKRISNSKFLDFSVDENLVRKKESSIKESKNHNNHYDGINIENNGANITIPFPNKIFQGNTPLNILTISDNDFILTYDNTIYRIINNKIIDSVKFENVINTIIRTSKNQLWIGLGKGGGAVCLNETDLHHSADKLLVGKSISSIALDKESNIWFSTTNDGVFLKPVNVMQHYSFNNSGVVSVCGGDDSRVWFSTTSLKFYSLDLNTNLINEILFKKPLRSYVTRGVYNGLLKKIALLTTNPLLFNPKNNLAENLFNHPVAMVSTPLSFAFDSIGYCYIGSQSGLTEISPTGELKSLIANFRVDGLVKTTEGRIFIGNMKGLFELIEGNAKQIVDSLSMFKERVTSLLDLGDGRLAVGTKGFGVIVYNYRQKTNPLQITTSNGLTSDNISSLFYYNGLLWAATNLGVNKISLSENGYAIESFTVKDGLSSNETNQVYANDSIAFVGTNNGLSVFNYKKVAPNNYLIPIYITGISINDRDTTITNYYNLSYLQNSISIDYVGLSYKSSGHIQYRYKLLGIEDEWQYTSSTNLRFPSLSPNTYKFILEASEKPGIWKSSFEPIVFEITPPIYDRLWFKILVLALIVSIIAFVFYLRIRQIRNRNKLREEMDRYRMQALSAQMNPHFIFNSLNSIQNYILQNEKKESNKYLAKFSRLMRMVFDNSQRISIPLSEEIEALTNYIDLEVLRFKNKFSYTLKVDDDVETDVCLVPPLIFQPFVENAIWHGFMHKASEGLLSIEFTKSENQLLVVIQDDGVGREKAREIRKATRPDHKSGGLANTEKRLEIINKFNHSQSAVNVVDLKNDQGEALGTRIEITLPYTFKQ